MLTLNATDVDDSALTYTLLQAPAGASVDASGHLSWTATDVTAAQTFQVQTRQGLDLVAYGVLQAHAAASSTMR